MDRPADEHRTIFDISVACSRYECDNRVAMYIREKRRSHDDGGPSDLSDLSGPSHLVPLCNVHAMEEITRIITGDADPDDLADPIDPCTH